MKLLIIFLFAIGCTTLETRKDPEVKVLPAKDLKWEKLNPSQGENGPEKASHWGQTEYQSETLVKIPAQQEGTLGGHQFNTKVLVIEGQPSFNNQTLGPGSLVSIEGFKTLKFMSSEKETLLFVRGEGAFANKDTSLTFEADDPKEGSKKRCSGWNYMEGCKK